MISGGQEIKARSCSLTVKILLSTFHAQAKLSFSRIVLKETHQGAIHVTQHHGLYNCLVY